MRHQAQVARAFPRAKPDPVVPGEGAGAQGRGGVTGGRVVQHLHMAHVAAQGPFDRRADLGIQAAVAGGEDPEASLGRRDADPASPSRRLGRPWLLAGRRPRRPGSPRAAPIGDRSSWLVGRRRPRRARRPGRASAAGAVPRSPFGPTRTGRRARRAHRPGTVPDPIPASGGPPAGTALRDASSPRGRRLASSDASHEPRSPWPIASARAGVQTDAAAHGQDRPGSSTVPSSRGSPAVLQDRLKRASTPALPMRSPRTPHAGGRLGAILMTATSLASNEACSILGNIVVGYNFCGRSAVSIPPRKIEGLALAGYPALSSMRKPAGSAIQ